MSLPSSVLHGLFALSVRIADLDDNADTTLPLPSSTGISTLVCKDLTMLNV